MRRTLIMLGMFALLLSGCASEEGEVVTVEDDTPAYAEQADSFNMFGVDFQSVGPMCGYVTSADSVEIYPYYKSPEHIKVKRMLLSDRGFWDTVKASTDNAVISEYKGYFMLTTESGETYGVIDAEADSVLLVKTDDLPSAYVKVVCDRLCQSNT